MKHGIGRWMIVVAFALAIGVMAGPTWAKKKSNTNTTPTPTPTPTNTENTQLQSDMTARDSAQDDLNQANQKLDAITAKLLAAYQLTPEWIDAQKQLTDAQAALDAAKQKVVDGLSANPDFQAALSAKEKAVNDLAAARADQDNATPETLAPLATAMLEASTKVSQIEGDAMSSDSGVTDAQQKVAAAAKVVAQIKQKFQDSLVSNADYTTAKQAVDAAHQKLADAQAKVSSDSGT